MLSERRKDRSGETYAAVRKQLAAIARDGEFRTVLIADCDGLVIAASNNDPINDSLGVLGVHYFYKRESNELVPEKTFVLRNRKDHSSIIVHSFTLVDQRVLLMALAKDVKSIHPLVNRAVSGAKRILEN
ncbi:hypothetical protein ACFL27_11630 [candidate division CSSED10-310 bacterium]|uniref:Roadblock/LAMTOR2 domain-containing protein n=1 Tax=candidate division CSSED10-310 bacterium TaxID=2855610 RepID=A0ABV6YXA9_UNCC1